MGHQLTADGHSSVAVMEGVEDNWTLYNTGVLTLFQPRFLTAGYFPARHPQRKHNASVILRDYRRPSPANRILHRLVRLKYYESEIYFSDQETNSYQKLHDSMSNLYINTRQTKLILFFYNLTDLLSQNDL